MQVLKFIMLLAPFNVLAHPGHDELLIQVDADDWLYAVAWLLLVVAAGAGIRCMNNRRIRLKSTVSEDD